jgi:hypothetical protein
VKTLGGCGKVLSMATLQTQEYLHTTTEQLFSTRQLQAILLEQPHFTTLQALLGVKSFSLAMDPPLFSQTQ